MYLVICKFQTIGNFLFMESCKFEIKISILNIQRLNNNNNNNNNDDDDHYRRIINIYEDIAI